MNKSGAKLSVLIHKQSQWFSTQINKNKNQLIEAYLVLFITFVFLISFFSLFCHQTAKNKKSKKLTYWEKIQNKINAFTLIDLLISIAIIIILTAIILVAINPSKQIKKANDAERLNDINSLYKAIVQYQLDNDGTLETLEISRCPNCDNIGSGGINLTEFLVPLYISNVPIDPDKNCNEIDTCYDICITADDRPIVSAPNITTTEQQPSPSSDRPPQADPFL